MAALDDFKAGASVRGLSPDGIAKVVQVEWFGDQAVKVTFEDATGAVKNRLVYRNEEPTLEIVLAGRRTRVLFIVLIFDAGFLLLIARSTSQNRGEYQEG